MNNNDIHCKSIIENSPALIFVKDIDGKYLMVNKRWEETIGLSREQTVGNTDLEMFDEIVAKQFMEHDKEVLNSLQMKEYEEILQSGNSVRYFNSIKFPMKDESGNIVGVCGIAYETTEQKLAQNALMKRLSYENLLSNISVMAVTVYDIDDFLDRALTEMGEAFGVSRAYIFEHDNENDVMDNTFEWCAPGIHPHIEELQGLPSEDAPWWMAIMKKGEIICFNDIEDIPDEGAKELLRPQGILSILVVPLFVNGEYYGFIGFDDCHEHRDWVKEDVELLLSMSRILVNVMERKLVEDELKESEKKFRNLVTQMQSGLALHEIILDENGIPVDYRFLDVNKAFEKITGLKKEDIIGKTVLEVMPQTEKLWIERYGRVALTGEPVEFENYASQLDRYYSVVAYRPQEKQFAVIVQEITERRRAEEKLKDNLALLRIAGEVAKLGGWNVNLEENRSYWSDVVAKIHEMPAGFAPMLEDGINFYAPEWRDKITKVFTDCAQKGVPYNEKMEIITSTGKRVWIKTIGEAVRNEKGEIFKVHGGFQDISEEVAAETELKESEERYKALHNASFGGIVIHDKGLILECNQGLSEITGFSYKELIGMNGLLLIAEHARDKVIKNINEGYELPYESVGVKKNGEEYPLRLEARNIPFKGKQVRTVEFRDVTEQKEAEIEKRKLEHQLVQAQKMESIGRLAGGIAHDFNNMLSVISGRVELALMKSDPESSLHSDLKEIRNASERSASLTAQLLAFARKQVISPKIISINETVENMIGILGRLIGENIELSWNPGKDIWNIMMDPTQIDQILTNLCVNSKDAITENGTIIIKTENCIVSEVADNRPGLVPDEYVKFSIEDNGEGMDIETASRIFEPFFTTKEIGKGTGLGLATVFGIVKQNKGYIYCDSTPGAGTSFFIYIPKRAEIVEENVKDKNLFEKETGDYTILLVEDEPSILEMAKDMLESFGYRVISAGSPQQALKESLEHKGSIDLLLTDVIMPEMNGRDLSKKITSQHPQIKCLFMSGYTAEVIAHENIIDEEMNFLRKPFTMNQLREKVEKIMGSY